MKTYILSGGTCKMHMLGDFVELLSRRSGPDFTKICHKISLVSFGKRGVNAFLGNVSCTFVLYPSEDACLRRIMSTKRMSLGHVERLNTLHSGTSMK